MRPETRTQIYLGLYLFRRLWTHTFVAASEAGVVPVGPSGAGLILRHAPEPIWATFCLHCSLPVLRKAYHRRE